MDNKSRRLLFHEISAGGIVVKRNKGRYTIAVIKRNEMGDWTLPKGHQERGESLQATAVREVLEEASIHAEPVRYLGSFTYSTGGLTKKRGSRRTRRTVHWFLMEYKKSKLRKSDREVERVRWVSINNDFAFMTYRNDRSMVEKAIKVIKRVFP